MKKTIAVTLYVTYAIFITLFIVFGASVSRAVIDMAKSILYARDITDVELNIDPSEPLLFGKTYYPIYTAVGDVYDAGLQFESLDPKKLKVASNGAIYAYNNCESDTTEARVRITSQYDRGFEKIVTFHFYKLYPDRFSTSYSAKSHTSNSQSLPLGIPVYVYTNIPTDVNYNVYQYDVLYDETYFIKSEKDNALIPIAPTPDGVTTTFTVRYANGVEAKSRPFSISSEASQATAIDEIRINERSINEYAMVVDRSAKLTLYYQGERVYGDYTVTFEKGEAGYTNKAYSICFESPGDKAVTVTLPNGFSKTFTIQVRNILSLPTLKDEELAKTHHISILNSEKPRYYYTFPENVTAKSIKATRYDETLVTITATDTYFSITPKKTGQTDFSLLVSDGYEEFWMHFTLDIKEDTSLSFFIIDNVGKIVSKYIGHLTLFVVLSWFALNMFRYIETKNRVMRFIRYTLCALPIAAVTEYWQTFIPQRTGAVEDVLVDMGSYYLGTLIALFAIGLHRAHKRHRAHRAQQLIAAEQIAVEIETECRAEMDIEMNEEIGTNTSAATPTETF